MITNKATTSQRLSSKKQTLDDAYAVPANFLEIDVINPITHGVANKRCTGYECLLKKYLSVKCLLKLHLSKLNLLKLPHLKVH